MTGDFDRRHEFDIFKKYGIEYVPPMFIEIYKPWGDSDFFVLEEVTLKPEIRNQIDKVNVNAINAPAGSRVLGEYKVKEYFKYRQSRKILLRMLKRENVKSYTWEEKEKYTNDYNNEKLKELQQAQVKWL